MKKTADLEISLHHRQANAYDVEFRFTDPESEADVRLGQGSAHFNLDELVALSPTTPEYGRALTTGLFTDDKVKTTFAQALAKVQALEMPMRLRLYIAPDSPELHALHWETLANPLDERPFGTSENVLFSRYLSSLDWRPVRLRAKGELRALVVVANPTDLAKYNLAPLDVQLEFARASESMDGISATSLPSEEGAQRATLNNILSLLRQNGGQASLGYDILYLVCHGVLAHDEPWLWLEDDDGKAKRVSGHQLATLLTELPGQPRLVVLASCQSAGDGNGAALAALGPLIAQSGVPAVLAMQGKISLGTLGPFMKSFFTTLREDGEVDHAVSVARGTVRERPDHWMPALYMRLRSGRIWYTPGFGGEQSDFDENKFRSITTAIKEGTCTAIIGTGLTDPLFGSRSKIALRWVEKHGYPLSPHDQEDLPRVAQYVGTSADANYLRTAYRQALRDEIQLRYADALPEETRRQELWSADELLGAIQLAAGACWSPGQENPYQQLARLRLPIYITAGADDLLKHALIAEGEQRGVTVEPVVRLCPWNNRISPAKCIYKEDPTPEKPLIYHLFGHLKDPFSLVITEDEYFDYLIGVTVNKDLIPEAVRAALTSTTLLFLGFRLDDWNFRVLFRTIMAQGGREMLYLFSHAAAQIEPEEGRIIDALQARRFLERYFEPQKISLYWGSSEEFLQDLWRILKPESAPA